MQYLMLIVFAWFVVRALFRPFEGLIGLLAVTMMNPGEIWPIFTTLHIERILVALTAVGIFIRPVPLVYPVLTKRLLFFWGSMFLTIPFSFWPGGSMGFTLDFGRIILYHFLTVNLIDTPDRFKKFVFVFALLIGWVGGGALWAYAHGSFDANALRNGFERAQGLTSSNGNPNSLGLTLVAGLPMVVLLFPQSSFWQKILASVIVILALIAMLLTGSRTTFSILCVLVGVSMLTSRKSLKFIPVIILLAFFTWSFTPEQYKQRYSAIVDITSGAKTDESFEAHRLARQAGLAMFIDYPILGVGAGQFSVAAGQHYWPGPVKLWLNPHNLYVQIPSELGIVGVIAWLGFLIPFVKMVFRLRKQLKGRQDVPALLCYFPNACLFALASLFLGGCFGHNLYRQTWYQLAALIVVLDTLTSEKLISHSAPEVEGKDEQILASA